jgi:hypothetical protein
MPECTDGTPDNRTRSYGRSIEDFRNQRTESGLLPAEDKLRSAVSKGEVCDLSNSTTWGTTSAYDELDRALSDPNVFKLAVYEIGSAPRLFGPNDYGKENVEEDECTLLRQELIRAQPNIVREFFAELRSFATVRGRAIEFSEIDVVNLAETVPPIIQELKSRFKSELEHWRHVDASSPDLRVRGSFLRFLALGGDAAVPVHEKGVRLKGAYIEGELDLTSCDDVSPLDFLDCFFSAAFNCSGANLRRLSLSGCCVPAIWGERCRTNHNIYLEAGFVSLGPACLVGAVIGGSLMCSGGDFRGGLDCATGKITGDVFLDQGFKAYNEVTLAASQVGGTLFCTGGEFFNQSVDGTGKALNCDAAKITGSVVMRSIRAKGRVFLIGIEIGYALELNGARIYNYMPKRRQPALQCQGASIKGNILLREAEVHGGVGLAGAKIGGTLDCSSAVFSNLLCRETFISPPCNAAPAISEVALDLSNAKIVEEFRLRQHESSVSSVPAKIKGSLDLSGAHAPILVDHPGSWPEKPVTGVNGQQLICEIKLDGFTYGRFAEGAPTNAVDRLTWLSLQPAMHLGKDFRPQPFEQLVKVLREMGHETDAQQVAIAKLRNRRHARKKALLGAVIETPSSLQEWVVKPYRLIKTIFAAVGLLIEWLIVDVILGNGYSKVRPVVLFFLILMGCAGFYHLAAKRSAFVPTNPVIYKDLIVRQACVGDAQPIDLTTPVDWYACKQMPYELNPFRPVVYSLDQMIPFLQLGQKRDWQPVSRPLEFSLWGTHKLTLPAWTTLTVTWFQSIGSTMLYLFIVAILSGLIRRD